MVVCRIRPVSASVWVGVLKNMSWVPTRMNTGSLFSAFTVLAITFPPLAREVSRPLKSFMFRRTVIAPLEVGAAFCVSDTASPARSTRSCQLIRP